MPPEFDRTPAPETPAFWADLEQRLRGEADRVARGLEAPATPDFDAELDRELRKATTHRARLEPLPIISVAAALMLVVLTAGVMALVPSAPTTTTEATPGTTSTTQALAEGSAEAMVVASFERWVDGRTEAERLQTRYLQAGYDVTIDRHPVTVAALNGQVLDVRHVAGNPPTTLADDSIRGQVILVVGEVYNVGDNISS